MSSYEEQIKKWAAKRYDLPLDQISSVEMESNFDEGYACCGGSDPSCYCSFASSASMSLTVHVHGHTVNNFYTGYEDLTFGNIGKLIQEIFEA